MRYLPPPARRAAALLVILTVLAAHPASTEPMHLLSAEPRPNQVMSGSGVAFALHFDHPLDHQASRFMLVGAGGARRTIPVRLQSQPSVLYGSVGQLPPGSYVLNWSARASGGGLLSGTLPFSVAPAR
ncbi:MAG TPA: copper resistance protein CopC [Acetobacteraceae bacterium]